MRQRKLAAIALLWLLTQQVHADPVVVCLGDSITKGVHLRAEESYPALLGTLLPGVRVINAGVGGNTSGQGLARLDRDVLKHHPQAVVILFGTNDSVLHAPGKYGVPLAEYRENLETMIRRCRQAGAGVVLGTLLPIDAAPYYTRHPREYYDAEGGLPKIVQGYRDTACEVARKNDVPLVDLFAAFASDRSLLRPPPDGVHPTAQGCRVIAEQVASELRKILKRETKTPAHLPLPAASRAEGNGSKGKIGP